MISICRRLPLPLIAWIVLVSGSPAHAHKGATEGPADVILLAVASGIWAWWSTPMAHVGM